MTSENSVLTVCSNEKKNPLFKQIVICLNKQLFVQRNNYLFEQRVFLFEQIVKHYFPMSSLGPKTGAL